MNPISSSHTPVRHSFEGGEVCSDTQPLKVTPTVLAGENVFTGAGTFRDGQGKSIVNREVRVIAAPEQSHGVITHDQASQCNVAQESLCDGAQQDVQPERTKEAELLAAPDPEILARQLDEVKQQIIDLTRVHGEIPHQELIRFKLAALYIQENFLIRMLYGMPSEQEAFSMLYSLGDLIPPSNGNALIKVLNLWWLPDNDKYFPEIESLTKFYSVCEQMKAVDKELEQTVESIDKNKNFLKAFEKLKKAVVSSDGNNDSSNSGSLFSELLAKESECKEALVRIRSILEKVHHETAIAGHNRFQMHSPASGDAEACRCRDEPGAVKSNSAREQQEGQLAEVARSPFSLTKLDKIVIIFHHLYQEYCDDHYVEVVNAGNVDFLDNYFNALLLETELAVHEKEIAYFAFLQALGHFYNKITMEYSMSSHGYSSGKNAAVKLALPGQVKTYNRILHKMTITSVERGICRVADYWVLNFLAAGFLVNYRWKTTDRVQLSALSSALERCPKQESEIALAKCTCFAIAEVLEDVEVFRSVAENSAKYNTLALLTMLWNDLGFSRWPYSTTLNPEKALEYLEFIQVEINDHKNQSAEIVKRAMDYAYELILLMRGSTRSARLRSERVALYYYMQGNPSKASALLEFARHKSKTLYFGLCMASKGKYQLAIQFIEKGNVKDVCVKALLGILYEKLASSHGELSDQFSGLLNKAELNYRAVIGSRPEMNKYLAMLLEKRGYLSGALKQWKVYQGFLHDQADKSNVRSVRFKIPMEIKLVGEKILQLENLLEEIQSEKNAHSLLGDNRFHRKQAEGKAPEGGPARKSKARKKSPPAVVRRQACQENCQEKKLPDVQTEKLFAIQMPDLEPERTLNSEPELEEQTDHQQQPGPDDNQWQLVTGKPEPVRLTVHQGVKIPFGLSIKEVERHWMYTRAFRNDLTNRLLLLDIGRENYNGILAIIDQYVGKIENPVAQLHFIQNKQWLLRCKSFDNRALYAQCRCSGQSIQAVKAELRLSILQCVQEQVESVFQQAFQCLPSSLWFSHPELLKKDINCLIGHVHPEFCVQFGAQFSTAAHVMKDIFWEFTCQRGKGQTCRSLYGHSLEDYSDWADKFYDFRNFIDPQHVSDVI
ncbi:hypothetical protein J7438_00100 [Thalassotalea sp. G20_0]|uniref:hypothetical protein n=1 Tax=Thalassotalea sp. G20_0 TaxID=2821093 RepID=UPI001ADA4253|nr:hypothetical protein [Thalassotalea sp. G20_0]MBO9492501.1 hypothetical protein [Thalassotalea sp. G20_0]